MRPIAPLAVALWAALLGFALPAHAQTRAEVTVFAAASLTNALEEAVRVLAQQGGAKVKPSFAASSTLAKQIESGAQAQIFLSADEPWMDYLDKRGLLAAGTRRPLLGNRLVLVVPADRPMRVDVAPGGAWLEALPPGRIAVGDPAHVPAGKYAQQALTGLGVWPKVEPRLARADNVRSALVLVERGEAAAGIVYATDAAISKGVVVAGTFPNEVHSPISYPIALVRGEDQGHAQEVYRFLISPEAAAVFTKYGFSIR